MFIVIELKNQAIRPLTLVHFTGHKTIILLQLTPTLSPPVNIIPCLERDVAQLFRGKTDNWTVLLVQLVDLPGKGAAEGIPGIGETRVFPEEGTRVRAQGIIDVVREEGENNVNAI
jgi:hypothetical protein